MYVSGSHSLAPDIFELAEACEGMDAAAKLAAARPLDPNASGEWVGRWVGVVPACTACGRSPLPDCVLFRIGLKSRSTPADLFLPPTRPGLAWLQRA